MAAGSVSGNNIRVPDGFFESREEEEEIRRSINNPQNEKERREIREAYRMFQDDISEKKGDMVNPGDEQDLLNEKLVEVDTLFRKVQMTREAALDSASLVNLSDVGKIKAQALKTDFVTFNPSDFCDKVRLTVAGDIELDNQEGFSHENWLTLGTAVQPFFKRTPVLRFMCGSFERGEVNLKRSRPVRENREEEIVAKTTKPTQLSSLEETDRGELTTAQVEHLLSTLWRVYEDNDNLPICYFEFVTNPHSFGQTVENIFYASFLVRDGHAEVFLDEENLPVIAPVQQEDRESNSQGSQKHQVIISITPREWREIVATFGIEEPVIKVVKVQDVLKEQNRDASEVTGVKEKGKGKGKGKKSVKK